MDYLTTEILGQTRSGRFMLGGQGPRGSSSSGQHLMGSSSSGDSPSPPSSRGEPPNYHHDIYYSHSDRTTSSSYSQGNDQRLILDSRHHLSTHMPGVHCVALPSTPTNYSKPSLYETYWHIPRASLWCKHNTDFEANQCNRCKKQDDNSSICSSINPPPTFTALDKYQPVKPRSRCSCNVTFFVTTMFSMLILVLITGFILYVELVLKHQTEYIQDRMVM